MMQCAGSERCYWESKQKLAAVDSDSLLPNSSVYEELSRMAIWKSKHYTMPAGAEPPKSSSYAKVLDLVGSGNKCVPWVRKRVRRVHENERLQRHRD